MELVIGTKRWSSWSLRPWLALKRTRASFEQIEIELRQGAATDAAIAQHSPSGQVPVLKVGDLTIWDSLAICEYLAETFPRLSCGRPIRFFAPWAVRRRRRCMAASKPCAASAQWRWTSARRWRFPKPPRRTSARS